MNEERVLSWLPTKSRRSSRHLRSDDWAKDATIVAPPPNGPKEISTPSPWALLTPTREESSKIQPLAPAPAFK